VAAFPVLLEDWLPAAGRQVTAIGVETWTRIAAATGLSAPRVEQVVEEVRESTEPGQIGPDVAKVTQELQTEATQPTADGTSYADPFGTRLAQQLRQQVLDSVWDEAGHLRPAVLTDPETREIIPGTEIGNPYVRDALTADGSNIADWGKYETGSIANPDGTLSFKIHFYLKRIAELPAPILLAGQFRRGFGGSGVFCDSL
jgi:hypothetical protein